MQNIPTKVDGVDVLPADQYNQPMDELENVITSTGITLSSGDLFQVAKSIANYAAHGDFYTDSGVADAYVLSALGSKQAPAAYSDGMRARTIIGNTNTGPSTVNIGALGVKNVVDYYGNALIGGEMIGGDSVVFEYNLSADNVRLIYPITGSVVQIVNVEDGALNTGTTIMPVDDTIPQNTEGDEYITLSITPKATTNKLVVEAIVLAAHSASASVIVSALFQDSTANSLAVVAERMAGADQITTLALRHELTAGTTSSTTFKIRIGSNLAGTTTFNGQAGARLFGGVAASSITITEYKA
jgi:hypothetical protein